MTSDDEVLEALKRLVNWYGKRVFESPENPDALAPIDQQEDEIAQAMIVIERKSRNG